VILGRDVLVLVFKGGRRLKNYLVIMTKTSQQDYKYSIFYKEEFF
jgi:hypothetical protein